MYTCLEPATPKYILQRTQLIDRVLQISCVQCKWQSSWSIADVSCSCEFTRSLSLRGKGYDTRDQFIADKRMGISGILTSFIAALIIVQWVMSSDKGEESVYLNYEQGSKLLKWYQSVGIQKSFPVLKSSSSQNDPAINKSIVKWNNCTSMIFSYLSSTCPSSLSRLLLIVDLVMHIC